MRKPLVFKALALLSCFTLNLLSVSPVAAWEIVSVDAIHDGATSPPGYLIRGEFLADPDDPPLHVSVKVFIQINAGDPPSDLRKIAIGTGDRRRELIEIKHSGQSVELRSNELRREVSIAIPYDGIVLPNGLPFGERSFGFTMIGQRRKANSDNVVIVSRSSSMDTIEITSEPRLFEKFSKVTRRRIESPEDAVLIGEQMEDGSFGWVKSTAPSNRFATRLEETPLDNPVRVARGFHLKPTYSFVNYSNTDRVFPSNAKLGDAIDGSLLNTPPTDETRHKRVHFATNRRLKAGVPAPTQLADFDEERDPTTNVPTYGTCVVNIPKHHTEGQIEVPGYWNVQDEDYHFFVRRTKTRSEPEFVQEFRNCLSNGKDDVLLLVHGFAVPFESAVLRLAQLGVDLRFEGELLAFVWPSSGVQSAIAYSHDADVADESHRPLHHVLKQLAPLQKNNGGRIHIIAHSMGNSVMLKAIEALDKDFPGGSKLLGHVVMAAADVSEGDFRDVAPALLRRSESVTVYYSPKDRALTLASESANWRQRLGSMKVSLPPDLDTIDASQADTSWIGHSYYGDVPRVLADLRFLLKNDMRASVRPLLKPQPAPKDLVFYLSSGE